MGKGEYGNHDGYGAEWIVYHRDLVKIIDAKMLRDEEYCNCDKVGFP